MSSASTTESLNFIEEIIEEDLNSGKHSNVQTHFTPEPFGEIKESRQPLIEVL